MTATAHPKPSSAFFLQAGLSFAVALLAIAAGVAYLPVNAWMQAFLAIGLLYVVTSSFTLAKSVRDHQEAATVTNRVDQARLARSLRHATRTRREHRRPWVRVHRRGLPTRR